MTPIQQEMCLIIQKAVVDFYGVPFAELITKSQQKEEVERRYVLFYLLKSTGVVQDELGKQLKVPQNTISVGQSYISDKMGIYPHILATLTAIINKIDSFDKNYVWQIAPLSKPKLPS